MAAKRPAKISKAKKGTYIKNCPTCQSQGKESAMNIVKMVRHSKPSGMFWVCSQCATEVPTQG